MRKNIFLVFMAFMVFPGGIYAQVVAPPPAPIVEGDLRDNSIRMRSAELERIKREANKLNPVESTKAREIKFAEIKNDFENIQKLQDAIVKTYTTGKTINYLKIGKFAATITEKALRLDKNLFRAEKLLLDKKRENPREEGVKGLIILLDNEIGNFVRSPIFKNVKVVDSKISKQAQQRLEAIIELSRKLSKEAQKLA